jgi:hypothetical protein
LPAPHHGGYDMFFLVGISTYGCMDRRSAVDILNNIFFDGAQASS